MEVDEDVDLETGRWRRTSSEQLRGLSVSRISITLFMATGLLMILSLYLFIPVISNKFAGGFSSLLVSLLLYIKSVYWWCCCGVVRV